MKCPNCTGTIQVLSQTAMFCLDCDWDNLGKLDFSSNILTVDAEWYTKTQLKEYRRWKDDDFLRVQARLDRWVWLQQPSWKRLPNVLLPSRDRRKPTKRHRNFRSR